LGSGALLECGHRSKDFAGRNIDFRGVPLVSPNLQHQILRKARGLLNDKRKWTRYGSARTGNGAICPPYATGAVKFCAYGALARAALELTGDRQQARRLARSVETWLVGTTRAPHPQKRLSAVNDRKGYAAIISLFDAAVEGPREP
jgi:hypothetical protein